jgi:hypothetical protein
MKEDMNWDNIHLDHKPVSKFNLEDETELLIAVIIRIFNPY